MFLMLFCIEVICCPWLVMVPSTDDTREVRALVALAFASIARASVTSTKPTSSKYWEPVLREDMIDTSTLPVSVAFQVSETSFHVSSLGRFSGRIGISLSNVAAPIRSLLLPGLLITASVVQRTKEDSLYVRPSTTLTDCVICTVPAAQTRILLPEWGALALIILDTLFPADHPARSRSKEALTSKLLGLLLAVSVSLWISLSELFRVVMLSLWLLRVLSCWVTVDCRPVIALLFADTPDSTLPTRLSSVDNAAPCDLRVLPCSSTFWEIVCTALASAFWPRLVCNPVILLAWEVCSVDSVCSSSATEALFLLNSVCRDSRALASAASAVIRAFFS